ncbi:MAG TPA: serine/threonine-protein kinase [Longimicrobiales bacterium]
MTDQRMRSAAGFDDDVRRALAPGLEIERALGDGASARVLLARDTALDRMVTVKLLRPEIAASAEARARFEREARAAASIAHPHVSSVYRVGALPDGTPYLVMQYVHGRTLAQRLQAEGPLRSDEARRVMADVAEALHAAHARGVIHRDIRPENVLLEDESGRAIVCDFGIAALNEAWARDRPAKLTLAGQMLGDPRYVSPEQFAGEPVDEATDVYGLGVVAFEMVTGRVPFDDVDLRERAAARHAGKPIVLPDHVASGDAELARLIQHCLARDPRVRPKPRAIVQKLRARPDRRTGAPVEPPLLPLPRWVGRAWTELAYRRVPQWVAATGAAALVCLELADQAVQRGAPEVLYRATMATGAAAVLAAAVLAWFHGARGEQRFRAAELVTLATLIGAWLVVLYAILA